MSENDSRQLHVVFGAGQIGPRLARTLLAKGHAVRVVAARQRQRRVG
jgi:nucleoside-diphosphate-sugar epimerase